VLIPDTPIVAAVSFKPTLPAPRVAAAIGRGLQAGGLPRPELCPIIADSEGAESVPELLDALDFDARMRRARAVVVGEGHLQECTLASRSLIGSAVFEIATRARQAGVPAYAVLAENALDSFDARILDLQVVLEARNVRALTAAGRKLARLI
jgi:glycerate kinase